MLWQWLSPTDKRQSCRCWDSPLEWWPHQSNSWCWWWRWEAGEDEAHKGGGDGMDGRRWAAVVNLGGAGKYRSYKRERERERESSSSAPYHSWKIVFRWHLNGRTHVTVLTQVKKTHNSAITLLIQTHMSAPCFISVDTHVHTHTHKVNQWALPAPQRVWVWCLSIVTRTNSILIALTPRTASTHSSTTFLSLYPSYLSFLCPHSPGPHPSQYSLVIVWVSPATSSCYTLLLLVTHTLAASKCPFLHMLL